MTPALFAAVLETARPHPDEVSDLVQGYVLEDVRRLGAVLRVATPVDWTEVDRLATQIGDWVTAYRHLARSGIA